MAEVMDVLNYITKQVFKDKKKSVIEVTYNASRGSLKIDYTIYNDADSEVLDLKTYHLSSADIKSLMTLLGKEWGLTIDPDSPSGNPIYINSNYYSSKRLNAIARAVIDKIGYRISQNLLDLGAKFYIKITYEVNDSPSKASMLTLAYPFKRERDMVSASIDDEARMAHDADQSE